MSQLFSEPEIWEEQGGQKSNGMADTPMGSRGQNGRYKLPLLPDEEGPKRLPAGVEPWVPGGLQSMTNLAGSISDTKALGLWELEQVLIGLARAEYVDDYGAIFDHLCDIVEQGARDGVNFRKLKNHPEFRALLADIAERAKDASGANEARDKGIYRHDVWEKRGVTGLFSGTPEVNAEIEAIERLLDEAGLEVVPALCERVVRNVKVSAAGRFDNIVRERRTGRLLMADMKTKVGRFWSFLEIDAQLAGYANSEWMLQHDPKTGEIFYIPGPVHHVDLDEGVVLHMPSGPDDDGKQEPALRRADLRAGWRALQLARQVCEVRSYGASKAREQASYWRSEK